MVLNINNQYYKKITWNVGNKIKCVSFDSDVEWKFPFL